MKVLNLIVMLFLLQACSQRGTFLLVDELPPERAALARQAELTEPVFVGTSRREEAGEFGFGRSEVTSYLRYDISIPREHAAGEVTWPRNARSADPDKHFLTKSELKYADAASFRHDVRAAIHARGQRDVVVYVHGFNNTMAESVYRVAQMHSDLKVSGVAVHYAWPSRGSPFGYVYDRDSAMFGRDAFENMLSELTKAGAERIIIVAHSMGGFLTMETLRQAALRDDRAVLNRLGGVILISPDLDVEVFRSQARAMGELPKPFVIFGSRKDSILGISSRIAGAPDRLGNLQSLASIADLNVTYFETAAYSQGAGHFNVGTSPALLQLLGGAGSLDAAFSAEARGRVGLLPGVALTLRNATAVVLSPVEAVAQSSMQ